MLILENPTDDQRFTVKNYSGATVGDVVGKGHDAKVAAKTEHPTCILVQVPSSKFPERNLLGLGDGALLDMTGDTAWPGAQAVGTVMYSDGAGAMTATKPTTGTAGQICWTVGTVEGDKLADTTTSYLRVKILPIRVEA